MNLTPHFTREEMERSSTAIRLGLDNTCPDELLGNMMEVAQFLEVVRNHFDKSIHVTSCYRSDAVNKAVGGSKTSAHSSAYAADFEVAGVANIDVCRWIEISDIPYDQIIYEFGPTGWVHMGFTHGKTRRQSLTATKVNGKTVYANGLIP